MRKEDIFEVIDRFENSVCTELEITDDRFSIKLRKGSELPADVQAAGAPRVAVREQAVEVAQAPVKSEPQASVSEDKKYKEVKSPIVGVFYAAPGPDEAPFVKVGDRVSKGDTLCLMEAMKMMNELKSPADGIIRAIHGRNGELAEFDEILFEVEEC